MAVIALVAVGGAVLAGAVVAGRFGLLGDSDELASAIREGAVVRVAEIAAAGDLPVRGVFVQTTPTGLLCLWDSPSASSPERRGGCNSVSDPLGGGQMFVSLSYDGGPEAADVSDALLIGLVSNDVSALRVLMSDGLSRGIPIHGAPAVGVAGRSLRAFGYRIRPSDLRKGLEPTAVLAMNGAGREVDRQATGFGG